MVWGISRIETHNLRNATSPMLYHLSYKIHRVQAVGKVHVGLVVSYFMCSRKLAREKNYTKRKRRNMLSKEWMGTSNSRAKECTKFTWA